MTNYIFLNLKRFDVLKKYGGVNQTKDLANWGKNLIDNVSKGLKDLQEKNDVEFAIYLQESHLLPALSAINETNDFIGIGCQGVYREDVAIGGNFGAFTSNRPATAMKQLGVSHTIIGHCEERKDKIEVILRGKGTNLKVVNELLNEEIQQAQKQGLKVLYCIGEKAEEKDRWQEVLKEQIDLGLKDVDEEDIVIGYEPIWAIGPGKTPPTAHEIKEIVDYLKTLKPNIPVIYGGGLKKDNAKEIAGIPSVDGGLIALTRFSGEIGFYEEEYLEIADLFLKGRN